jgi:hypothetical protein
MQDIALACLAVRAPLAIVNLVQCFVVDPATTLLLTVLEIAQIYVPEERVDQAALATPTILLPTALVDRSVKLNQLTDAVSNELLIVLETSAIDVTILHYHLSVVAHIILPDTFELRSISPRHDAEPLTFASFKQPFISCFFIFRPVVARQTSNILDEALTTSSTVFKVASEGIAIVKADSAQAVKTPVLK